MKSEQNESESVEIVSFLQLNKAKCGRWILLLPTDLKSLTLFLQSCVVAERMPTCTYYENTSFRWPLPDFRRQFEEAIRGDIWESDIFQLHNDSPGARLVIRVWPKVVDEDGRESLEWTIVALQVGSFARSELHIAGWFEAGGIRIGDWGEDRIASCLHFLFLQPLRITSKPPIPHRPPND